ncbi:lipase 3 [Anabrus simplex]|uniref:lipase 3 n=1 Tax=Anabrus simplex TaxID=316456 RepID=UPI0035A2D6E9
MSSLIALLWFSLLTGCLATASTYPESEFDLRARDPDTDLTTPELIAKYGYPVESHTVQTEDGYILTLHRIPYGKKSSSRTNRPPVLVQHGLLSSSVDWIVMGPEKGLGYILADAGYDVWLGNARGNTWSKKHITLSPSQSKFWQFSWHEMGVYDLPAVIDYILERTGEEKLFYIGHSMGTTMFYVMASEKPEYNNKIRAMFSLAPVAYMSHAGTPFLKALAFAGDQIGWFTNLMGLNEFLPHTELLTIMGQMLCRDEAITQDICNNVFFLINGGYNSKELDSAMIPVILGHTPAGAATKNFLHYAQSIKTKKFRQYNYGWLKNLAVYGSTTPPKYDMSKITAPIALMYGMNDDLGAPGDVATLNKELPNVISYYKVADEQFGHLDFLWAIHGKSLLYNEILNLMAKY